MVKKADRTPVGAHYGWQDWLAQRVTAVIMAMFSFVFLGFFMVKGSVDYAEWRALFHSQLLRILALLFLFSMFYHAWIGKGVHPVSTGVVVTALARPDWLVEIDATAVIPD